MSGTHALFAPSKSAIWAHCLGAFALLKREGKLGVEGAPKEYSASGTYTHSIAQRIGENNATYESLPAQETHDGFTFTLDQERYDRALAHVERVRSMVKPGGIIFWETKFDLSFVLGVADQAGSSDAVVLNPNEGELHSFDLKDGVGIVPAADNDQLVNYLLAVWDAYQFLGNFTKFYGHIDQPRRQFWDTVEYTVDEMTAHSERMRRAAGRNVELMHETANPKHIAAALSPSDKACQWCPRAQYCEAREKQIVEKFPLLDAAFGPGNNGSIGDERLAELLSMRKGIEDAFKGWAAEALTRVKGGATLPGWKLVTGRQGNRDWLKDFKYPAPAPGEPPSEFVGMTTDEILYQTLEHKAYKPKVIISPTDAQKALKKFPDTWTALQQAITRAAGVETLAPDVDPRQCVSVEVAEFENVETTGSDLI